MGNWSRLSYYRVNEIFGDSALKIYLTQIKII